MIDPLRRFSPLSYEFRKEHAARTPSGEPWVTWVKTQDSAGWCAWGSRLPPKGTGFEAVLFEAAHAALGGGNLDQVHVTCPESVLAIGALGATLTSGQAPALLYECLVEKPAWFLEAMHPVMRDHPWCLRRRHGLTRLWSEGTEVDGIVSLARLVRSERAVDWTPASKESASLWVSSVSKLLRHEDMDRAQSRYVAKTLPMFLPDEVAATIGWPLNGVEDAWQYFPEQKAVWVWALVLNLFEDAQLYNGVDSILNSTRVGYAQPGGFARLRLCLAETPNDFGSALFARVCQQFGCS